MTELARGPYQHGKALYEESKVKSSDSSTQLAEKDTEFNNALHLKYWKRCLTSLLPNAYQSNDSSRMTLAFFTLSALDLLGEGADKLSLKDRQDYRDWVLSCQHPITGGFCGSPNHKYPDSVYEGQTGKAPTFEPASLTATFFAMLNLNFLGSITQANRKAMWMWLKKLQRKDGSFGEMLTAQDEIYGSRDMRICLCGAAVRWMLRLDTSVGQTKEDDIDVDALVKHIVNSEAYDGAIGETSQLESHAGYTYCAIAALSYLDRLPPCIVNPWTTPADGYKLRGLTKLDDTIRWCMMRQVTVLAHESGKDGDDSGEETEEGETQEEIKKRNEMADEATNLRALTKDYKQYIGCNGRLNKDPDTCYSFWVGGSLDMMGQNVLIDRDGARRWLMKKTQHMIGGFGKMPGYPPDIYHSYMGLAALSVYNTTGLLPLDSALAISQASKAKLEADMKRLCKPKAYPSLLREYTRIAPDEEPEKEGCEMSGRERSGSTVSTEKKKITLQVPRT